MGHARFGGRTLARSQALQLLFQAEALGLSVDEVLEGPYALSEGPLDDYGRDLALGADGMRHELDAVISHRSTSWSLGRMCAVDRNLLRLSLYEMLCVDEVDVAVSIDECVELARAFGTNDSSRFVNGLLGRVADDLEAGLDPVALAQAALASAGAGVQTDDAGETDDVAAGETDADPEGGFEVDGGFEAADGDAPVVDGPDAHDLGKTNAAPGEPDAPLDADAPLATAVASVAASAEGGE